MVKQDARRVSLVLFTLSSGGFCKNRSALFALAKSGTPTLGRLSPLPSALLYYLLSFAIASPSAFTVPLRSPHRCSGGSTRRGEGESRLDGGPFRLPLLLKYSVNGATGTGACFHTGAFFRRLPPSFAVFNPSFNGSVEGLGAWTGADVLTFNSVQQNQARGCQHQETCHCMCTAVS
jgi:hypothetical protein